MCKDERGDLVIVLKDINKSFEEKQVLKRFIEKTKHIYYERDLKSVT